MAFRKAGPSGGSSNATREIAALDFLLNIPLEAEQGIVRSGLEAEENVGNPSRDNNNVTTGTLGDINRRLDRSYSIDEEEKVELDIRVGGGGRGIYNSDDWTMSSGATWWQPMIQKNKEFFAAEEERIKRREQLELETGILEAPNGSDALSSMEEGKLQNHKEQHQDNDGNKSSIMPNSVSNASLTRHHRSSGNLYDERSTFAPGRRLHGHEATRVKIPLEEAKTELKTTMRTVVRKAAVREWERKMVSSRDNENQQCLLDGRIYFSGMSSYPMAVFSVIKYEPRREEENRRRKHIEALGGGGSQFVMPSRDWRGVSYRSLLPRGERKNAEFNKIIKQGRKMALKRRKQKLKKMQKRHRGNNVKQQKLNEKNNSEILTSSSGESFESNAMLNDGSDIDDVPIFDSDMSADNTSISRHSDDEISSDDLSTSSEESTTYLTGFLDDPEMTKGRHRHVMKGDQVTGCVISSTIHFVSPVDLKADLNKQFRERFDQWEPPKPQRKYIGARVIDGCYTLIDPTGSIAQQEENDQRTSDDEANTSRRHRKGSIAEIDTIRMPPSLTLSKIRNLKQQALLACIDSNIEISTVALASVYFERLCLDCRVDKSNRRLTFAACLLIAIKINESNIALVHEESSKPTKKGVGVIKSWITTKKDSDKFASILEFFTHEWSLSLQTLFAAEFGVFAALGFKLNTKPSEVAFHFKRIMKSLEWSSIDYLGKEMYEQWQSCLLDEQIRNDKKQQRKERRKHRKEDKFLQLQHTFQMMEGMNNKHQQSSYDPVEVDESADEKKNSYEQSSTSGFTSPSKKKAGISILNRFKIR